MCQSREVEDSEKQFLESNEHGQRLLVAETALRLIQRGELSHLKRIVANASFVARAITDESAFKEIGNGDVSREQLIRSSETSAYLLVNLLGVPQATLFYRRDSGPAELQLFGAYFPKLIEMIYGAIGLDVERAASLDAETLSKLLRSGIPNPVSEDGR